MLQTSVSSSVLHSVPSTVLAVGVPIASSLPVAMTASVSMSTSQSSVTSLAGAAALITSSVVPTSLSPHSVGSSGSGPASTSQAGVAPQVATVSASGTRPSRGGVVVGVVGSVGSDEADGRNGASIKRKRGTEELEEPGSSVPSTKKRHIRLLRPRAHVSASTSPAPDTQGSSMAKVQYVCYPPPQCQCPPKFTIMISRIIDGPICTYSSPSQ